MKHSFSAKMVETTGGFNLLALVSVISGPRGAERLQEPFANEGVVLTPNLGYIVTSNG